MNTYNESIKNRILEYIKKYQEDNGQSPSFRKIKNDLDLASLSMVHRYVLLLENEGLIEKTSVGGVAIPLALMMKDTIINAPLVGQVACGSPSLALEEVEEMIPLPTSVFGGGETYLLRAKGRSMIEAGIEPGDLLVVKKDADFLNGDMVIALIGDEATAKRIYFENGKVILHPENKTMKDIVVDDIKELQIRGRVVNIIKDVARCKGR